MSKHTPGPWAIIRNLNSITVYSDHANADGRYLDADIADTGDCSIADAHLIAAAPDLLAFAESVLTWARQTAKTTGVTPWHLADAESVIRKAKGE